MQKHLPHAVAIACCLIAMGSSAIETTDEKPGVDGQKPGEATRSMELERLDKQIAEEFERYRFKSRRKFFPSEREDPPAVKNYVDQWQAKIEYVGTRNMPKGTYGCARLTTAIRADGSLEGVVLIKSSGNATLDRKAESIARMAQPFAKFPAEMRDIEVLHITRTWCFKKQSDAELKDAAAQK